MPSVTRLRRVKRNRVARLRRNDARKKKASTGFATGSRHVGCAQCGVRRTRCRCFEILPARGMLQTGHFREYIRFLEADAGGRRFLSDCLDVSLLCQWLYVMIAQGGVSMMLFAGVVFFRHFNRVSSFGAIVSSMEPGKKTPMWKELEASLEDTTSPMKSLITLSFSGPA